MSDPQSARIAPPVIPEWVAEAEQHIRLLASKSRAGRMLDFDPISSAVESGSRRFLSSLATANPPAPFINPTRRGTIQFEWEHGPRYLEIEIHGERAAQWFYQDDEAREELYGTLFEDEPLDELMDRIRLVVGDR